MNQLRYPSAVRVDSSGNVYVADSHNDRILLYRPPLTSGMSGELWGSGFKYPTGIEFDPNENGIWINDTSNHMVELWNLQVTSVLKVLYKDVYSTQPPDPWPTCNSPVDVCYQDDSRGSIGITQNGDLFIASSSNNQETLKLFMLQRPTEF